MNATTPLSRSDMEAFWLPFTPNRQFKAKPRLLSKAKGMYYWTPDGRQILDAVAGLWCVNAGHGRTPIVEAIRTAAGELDFAPSFQMGHPMAFEFAARLANKMPAEPADTALTAPTADALAYH